MINNKSRVLAEQRNFDCTAQDQSVAEYLKHSPEFFIRNPDVLMNIEVPHAERGTVSLVERKLTLQRERFGDLRKQLSEIVDVAHQNDQLAAELHQFSVGLMAAPTLAEVFEFTEQTLIQKLDCEALRAVIFRNPAVFTQLRDIPDFVSVEGPKFARSVQSLHNRRPVYCGHATAQRISQFFPDCDLAIRSMAILQLKRNGPARSAVSTIPLKRAHQTPQGNAVGCLAIASESKKRFAPHMGTDFLARFGELLSARISVFYD